MTKNQLLTKNMKELKFIMHEKSDHQFWTKEHIFAATKVMFITFSQPKSRLPVFFLRNYIHFVCTAFLFFLRFSRADHL